MSTSKYLREVGQSIWLDNITRDILDDGSLGRSISKFSLTGLTSNPTIFEHALRDSTSYDDAIAVAAAEDASPEQAFFSLALEDLGRAADLFQDVHLKSDGVDGFVSLEVSPLLAHDTSKTLAAARDLHTRSGRNNLFIKIPGTQEGLPAIEEAIFAGIPVNVTLLFSASQYLAAAEAWLRGIERRIEAGLNPCVASVASVFISRWDVAIADAAPDGLKNKLGIAIAGETYRAYLKFLASNRVLRATNFGARPQRLLWASTGTKDPAASDSLYITALAAPFTVNTAPQKTIQAFYDHGRPGPAMAADGGDCDAVLAAFAHAGIDVSKLAARLQQEGTRSFVGSWNDLIERISAKMTALNESAPRP